MMDIPPRMSRTLIIATQTATAFLVGAFPAVDWLMCGMVYAKPAIPQMMRRIPTISILYCIFIL